MYRFLPPTPVTLLSFSYQSAVITQLLCGSLVVKSCPTVFATPMDCSPPCSSVLGISQARILEWVAISSSRGSSWPRNWTRVSCIAGRLLTAEPVGMPLFCYFVLPCSGCLLGQIRIRKVKDFIFSVFIPSLMLLFSLCRSRFLTCIIFLLLEGFFFPFFCRTGLLVMSLSVCFIFLKWKSLYFSFILNNNIHEYRILRW